MNLIIAILVTSNFASFNRFLPVLPSGQKSVSLRIPRTEGALILYFFWNFNKIQSENGRYLQKISFYSVPFFLICSVF
jgi:hypothetical protein